MKKAARIVTPYSAVQETGENVPALKHFFRFDETSGSVLSDAKGGVIVDLTAQTGQLTFNVPNAIGVTEETVAPINGSWHSFSQDKHIVALAVFNVTGTGAQTPIISIGDINGYEQVQENGLYVARGIGMSEGPFHAAWGVAIPVLSGYTQPGYAVLRKYANPSADITGTLYNGQNIAYVLADTGDTNGIFTAYGVDAWDTKVDANTFNTPSGAIISPPLTGITSPPSNATGEYRPLPFFKWRNAALYGLAYFEFTTIPADLQTACKWMAAEWKAGRKHIYPGWVGKT